jgi:hypothetical protein
MSKNEHRGEIWSTRVQQELLALTTDNGDMEATTEARSILPPFASVTAHRLDIADGTCTLTVQVDIILPGKEPKEDGDDEHSDEAAAAATATATCSVVIEIDASLKKHADGHVNNDVPSYPFVPPIARLKEGRTFFPPGSTIQEGNRIGMDLDWTPSLHLTDAIMNIALKIKESIVQLEPFHPEPEPDPIAEAVDEMTKSARRFASKIGQRATMMGKAFSPRAAGAGGGASARQVSPKDGTANKKKQTAATTTPSPNNQNKKAAPGDVKIGDEINLLEEPWDNAHGVYSCKAIRRPPFVEEVIAKATKKQEQLSSPSAMFRSLAQSARSVMEEGFLMITDTHIIELKASKLNMQIGTVVFCIPIEQMAKLKFRRQESLSLFFKTAPEDPLVYLCPDSGDAVHQIQSVLKQKGVRGKHTNAAAYRTINEAIQMVQAIQTKEMALEHEPSVKRVNEIMDLYRQAAERFEIAGDIRHEEVVTHMKKFLAKPTVAKILDGSYAKPVPKKKAAVKSDRLPQGEVLERAPDVVDSDEEDDPAAAVALSPSKEEELESDKAFEENIDNLLADAKEDFGDFLDDSDNLDIADTTGDGLEDMAADLDAMMKEADKELAELMNS